MFPRFFSTGSPFHRPVICQKSGMLKIRRAKNKAVSKAWRSWNPKAYLGHGYWDGFVSAAPAAEPAEQCSAWHRAAAHAQLPRPMCFLIIEMARLQITLDFT